MSFFTRFKNILREALRVRKRLPKKEEGGKEIKKEWFEPEGKLAIDVFKTDGEIVIEAPVAGVQVEDLNISIKGDVVTIRGYRERPTEVEKKDYFSQECYWGKFSRQVILPEETDPGRAEAAIKEGILTIKIPKIQREKERVVEIKEKSK